MLLKQLVFNLWHTFLRMNKNKTNLSDDLSGVNTSLFLQLSHDSNSWIFTLVYSTLLTTIIYKKKNILLKWFYLDNLKKRKTQIESRDQQHLRHLPSTRNIQPRRSKDLASYRESNHQQKHRQTRRRRRSCYRDDYLFGRIHETDTYVSSITFRWRFHRGRRRRTTTSGGGGGGCWRLTAAMGEGQTGEFERFQGVFT